MQLKRITMQTAALMLGAGLPLAAQNHSRAHTVLPGAEASMASHALRCLAQDGKTPCTAAQVEMLNQGLSAERQSDPALDGVRSVVLASPDGTLRCTQNSGAPCTAAQWGAVRRDAAKKKKGGGSCLCVMRTIDKASV